MQFDFRAIEKIDLSANNIKSNFGKNQENDGFFGLIMINIILSGIQCIVE